jgi:hypothetical protein
MNKSSSEIIGPNMNCLWRDHYAAALIDQGTIFISRHVTKSDIAYTLRVDLRCPWPAIRNWLEQMYPTRGSWYRRRWKLSGRDARDILLQVAPYLIRNKEAALVAITFYDRMQTFRLARSTNKALREPAAALREFTAREEAMGKLQEINAALRRTEAGNAG